MKRRVRRDEHLEKTLFARRSRQVVGLISGGLLLFFGWLQLRDLAVESVINDTTPDIIWRAALIIYFTAWTFGTLFDTNVQEIALASVPNKGRWPAHTFGVVILLAIVAFVLCWTRGDIQAFAIALTIFVLVDHAAWRYLVWFLKPSIQKSYATYTDAGDFFAIERLNVVTDQIEGNWKWLRLFIVALPVVLAINLFAFVEMARLGLAQITRLLLPSLSTNDAAALAASGLVMIFVLGMEMWHWAIRINTQVSLDLLERLSTRYRLVQQ
jgi:hypothetical protein